MPSTGIACNARMDSLLLGYCLLLGYLLGLFVFLHVSPVLLVRGIGLPHGLCTIRMSCNEGCSLAAPLARPIFETCSSGLRGLGSVLIEHVQRSVVDLWGLRCGLRLRASFAHPTQVTSLHMLLGAPQQ
jgi:hypothetical protein